MLLDDALRLILIRFFLDMAEILCLCTLVAQTFFMAMQEDVIGTDAARDIVFR